MNHLKISCENKRKISKCENKGTVQKGTSEDKLIVCENNKHGKSELCLKKKKKIIYK